MATAKQIAARKKFAEMARSGALAKKRKTATKKTPVKKSEKNPIAPRKTTSEKRFMNPARKSPKLPPLRYRVSAEHNGRWGTISNHRHDSDAIYFAEWYANEFNVPVKVEDTES